MPKGRSDCIVASVAQQREAGVSQRRKIFRAFASASTTFVFTHRHIANPMQPVLDGPVPTIQIKETSRIRLARAQACNRMRNICDTFASDNPRAFNSNGLCKPRPSEIACKTRTGLKMTDFDSSMPFVNVTNLVKLLTAKAFAVGGKGRD